MSTGVVSVVTNSYAVCILVVNCYGHCCLI